MAFCALTTGYDSDCINGVGGVKEVYIIRTQDIEEVVETSGVVTSIVKKPGTKFYRYKLPRETANAQDAATSNEQNGTSFNAQTVQIILNKRQTSIRNEIRALARLRVTIVVIVNEKGENGKNMAWLYGREQGLMLGTGTHDTGTAWGDRNGYTLPFTGNEVDPAIEIASAVIETLETPGA